MAISLSTRSAVPLRSFRARADARGRTRTVALVGPSGAGKTTDPARDRRARAAAAGRIALGRRRVVRRRRGRFDVAADERARRARLPGLRALPAPHRPPERRVRAAGRGRRVPRALPHLAPRRRAPGRALRRRAPAGRARPRARARPGGAAPRRAARSARRAHEGGRPRASCRSFCTSSRSRPSSSLTTSRTPPRSRTGRRARRRIGSASSAHAGSSSRARPTPFVASFTGANLLHGWAGRRSNGLARIRLEDGTVISSADPAEARWSSPSTPGTSSSAPSAPHDSAVNVIEAPIRTITELGNRVRLGVGPISAEITSESLHRLDLRVGQTVFAASRRPARASSPSRGASGPSKPGRGRGGRRA